MYFKDDDTDSNEVIISMLPPAGYEVALRSL